MKTTIISLFLNALFVYLFGAFVSWSWDWLPSAPGLFRFFIAIFFMFTSAHIMMRDTE